MDVIGSQLRYSNHVGTVYKVVYCPSFFFRDYYVFVPKFSIKTSYSLKDVLSEMGMTDMFGATADLSGISEEVGLAVSEVSTAKG